MGKTYRQITYKLRVSRGPGRPDLISVRPCKKDRHGNRLYTDSDEKPTLVMFDEHCQLADLPFWLKVGHVVEYTPPVVKAPPRAKAPPTHEGSAHSRDAKGGKA